METIFRYVKTGGMEIPKFKFKVGDIVTHVPRNESGFVITKQDIYFGSYSLHKDYPNGNVHDLHGVHEEYLKLDND